MGKNGDGRGRKDCRTANFPLLSVARGVKEGREEGREEGRMELIRTIHSKGISVMEIAQMLDMDPAKIELNLADS